ncbi:hypothetical protein CALVIDRAFT_598707 [Calocera viscosa TUFC12733]|uniref:Elongator complex protein 4 n=1 Tax=Calocera viscosa (strain TUFC12733) TaxID=1330018 RepID=A0A167LTD9_CALVF|nr:hypothetical protein CALVIDRAFT_598707 [Calocera viscosa TUFC12733]
MSAFKRRVPASAHKVLPGVRPSALPPFHPLLSIGVPSFDDVLGGGLPLATSLLVMSPDLHSAWAHLIQKYFIAQGIRSGQDVCLIGEADEIDEILNGCMWVPPEDDNISGRPDSLTDDERDEAASGAVKIAWRYEGMKQFSTTVSHNASSSTCMLAFRLAMDSMLELLRAAGEYCSNFDLTRRIPLSVISEAKKSGQISTVPIDLNEAQAMISSALLAITEACDTHSTRAPKSTDRVLRIAVVIPSLLDVSSLPRLLPLVHNLRYQLRRSSATALITLPPNLCASSSQSSIGSAMIQLSDAVITLASDSLSPSTSHHGIVQLLKLPSLNSLVPPSDKLSTLRGLGQAAKGDGHHRGGGENNLAFRCKRRHFVIETLNLDVEGGVGERRTAPPAAVLLPSAPERSVDQDAEAPSSLVDVHAISKTTPSTSVETSERLASPKKPKAKRRVAFSDAGGIYDF